MGMFTQYAYTETPPIPPYAELPDERRDIHKFLRNLYLTHDAIAKVVYREWLNAGQPDGEAPSHIPGLKIKECHWLAAKMLLELMADTDIDIVYWGREAWKVTAN